MRLIFPFWLEKIYDVAHILKSLETAGLKERLNFFIYRCKCIYNHTVIPLQI